MVAPDQTKITVLTKGTPKGFGAIIPTGGQIPPKSTLGNQTQYKKAQKKEKKNKTSDSINKSIPIFKLFWTLNVWSPK